MNILYFILCAYGLTQILVHGTIFEKIRPKHHFFHCSMCIGFWTGVFLLGISPYTKLFTFEYNLLNAFLLGCLSSATSYVLTQLFGDHGINTNRS